MGSESFGTKMREVKWQESSSKPSKFMIVSSRHKRSKSDPYRKVKEDSLGVSPEASQHIKLDMNLSGSKKKHSPKIELQSSLKQEILELEKRLKDQFATRNALENALGYRASGNDGSNEILMPKPAKELIKDIAVLEFEVVHLEQYLLSLYRIAFDQQITSLSPSTIDVKSKSSLVTPEEMFFNASGVDTTSEKENTPVQSTQLLLPQASLANQEKEPNFTESTEKSYDSSIHRSHSSFTQHSPCATRASPIVRPCHSQPLSFMEQDQSASTNLISLAEHLGTRIADHISATPNRLAEDMIKCMVAIYCKLADPPMTHQGVPSSPISSMSSISAFSPQDQCDIWSPRYRKDSSFDARLENPFNVKGLKEFSGPYCTMVEVPFIYRDDQKLQDVDDMLQTYRSLVCRLEEVDPRTMKHEEKLAFWINIHNALVMHAFLAFGIPQNSLKRVSLLLKAAYNVGGHTVNIDVLQSSILGYRMPRPAQWLWTLFSSKAKLKAGDVRTMYAIEHGEPLLHFALCSGSHSDAAVRVYTPKGVVQELEAAKEEYIRANFGVSKEQKILLPKMLESFAKDSGMCPMAIVDLIQQCMPDSLRKTMRRCLRGKTQKSIQWIPHNFAFRYLISKDLIN